MHTQCIVAYPYVLRAEHTTPRIPYMVKNMLTLVGVSMFMTGRMALMLKSGVRAFSREGWLGSEQFTSMALHRAAERVQKLQVVNML